MRYLLPLICAWTFTATTAPANSGDRPALDEAHALQVQLEALVAKPDKTEARQFLKQWMSKTESMKRKNVRDDIPYLSAVEPISPAAWLLLRQEVFGLSRLGRDLSDRYRWYFALDSSLHRALGAESFRGKVDPDRVLAFYLAAPFSQELEDFDPLYLSSDLDERDCLFNLMQKDLPDQKTWRSLLDKAPDTFGRRLMHADWRQRDQLLAAKLPELRKLPMERQLGFLALHEEYRQPPPPELSAWFEELLLEQGRRCLEALLTTEKVTELPFAHINDLAWDQGARSQPVSPPDPRGAACGGGTPTHGHEGAKVAATLPPSSIQNRAAAPALAPRTGYPVETGRIHRPPQGPSPAICGSSPRGRMRLHG